MKWLLLLTILSGYSGSSTVAANFDSKDVCDPAAKRKIGALAVRSTRARLAYYDDFVSVHAYHTLSASPPWAAASKATKCPRSLISSKKNWTS